MHTRLDARTGNRDGAGSGAGSALGGWSPELVTAALAVMWRVVEAQEAEGPGRLRCAWPEVQAERWDYGDAATLEPRALPAPEEIDLADQLLPALTACLGYADRRVVAMRLAGKSWRAIARVDGRGKSWLAGSVWPVCVKRIGRHLQARRVAVPETLRAAVEAAAARALEDARAGNRLAG